MQAPSLIKNLTLSAGLLVSQGACEAPSPIIEVKPPIQSTQDYLQALKLPAAYRPYIKQIVEQELGAPLEQLLQEVSLELFQKILLTQLKSQQALKRFEFLQNLQAQNPSIDCRSDQVQALIQEATLQEIQRLYTLFPKSRKAIAEFIKQELALQATIIILQKRAWRKTKLSYNKSRSFTFWGWTRFSIWVIRSSKLPCRGCIVPR